jgi:hypothetical protein
MESSVLIHFPEYDPDPDNVLCGLQQGIPLCVSDDAPVNEVPSDKSTSTNTVAVAYGSG